MAQRPTAQHPHVDRSGSGDRCRVVVHHFFGNGAGGSGQIGDTSESDSSEQSTSGSSESTGSSSSAQGNGETVTVESGDTLAIIANEHGVDGGWRSLYSINSDVLSSPNTIYVGQQIELGN